LPWSEQALYWLVLDWSVQHWLVQHWSALV
jgi:hypothetical protein